MQLLLLSSTFYSFEVLQLLLHPSMLSVVLCCSIACPRTLVTLASICSFGRLKILPIRADYISEAIRA